VNRLGRAAQGKVPEPVRKLFFLAVFEDTAAAFRRSPPPLLRRTLPAFRDFTARLAVEEMDTARVSQRLFEVTRAYGKILRFAFGISSMEDVMAAARVCYRALGIDFQGDTDGRIVVSRCFFSDAYTPGVCSLMSALDRGLLDGLSDGGELVFCQRITEGHPCCIARFARAEAPL
jgi:hypothetical protein